MTAAEIRAMRETIREADKRAYQMADEANEKAETSGSLQEQNKWLAVWNRISDVSLYLENAADELDAIEKTIQ